MADELIPTTEEPSEPATVQEPSFASLGQGVVPADDVRLRVAWPLSSFDSRVAGAPIITRSWTLVPASLAPQVIAVARANSVTLED